jgi:cytochrome c551/c552
MRLRLVITSLATLALLVYAGAGGDLVLVAHSQETGGPAASVADPRALVNDYCAYCHDDSLKEGGFSWSEVDVANPHQNAEQAEKVIRKLRSGMMPPAGAPRPDERELKALASTLEYRIDQAAAATPNVDAPDLHRVNRKEYRNSIRDLLDVDMDMAALLPPDAKTGGFDNMAEALTVTPGLMQAYVRAAESIARLAVGDPDAPAIMTEYDVPKVINQMRHIDGTPFGTRGGMSVMHNFPADGEYSFQSKLWYVTMGELVGRDLPESMQGQQMEVAIDGERVGLFTIHALFDELGDGIMDTGPVQVQAGAHRVSASFISKFEGPVEDQFVLWEQTLVNVDWALKSPNTMLPHLRTMTVTGPLKVTGVSETASRRKIFTCYPSNSGEEDSCAAQIMTDLATRGFRRPTTAEDLESLMQMYQLGRASGNFEDGVRTAVQTLIAMPDFVFRFERVPAGVGPGETYRISDLELASRLSYFLWGTAPDDTLLDIASEGRLRAPGVLEQQVRRMLADSRSETLSSNFAMQWLRLTGIEEIHPEGMLFPEYTRNLGHSMRREVELLFDSIKREDRSVLDLLTANYTFVDEALATHYGLPNVVGNRFRRVELDDPNRFGLLGKAAVLTVTSLANRTSPVARGKYVLEVLVGSPPPLPPPVVPPFKEAGDNDVVLTVRERMVEHRSNPVCNACHKIMDPIGLTMENFDAIGRWRPTDRGVPVDASSKMYDGTPLDGPASLRTALVGRSDGFLGSFAQNLLAYSLGRVLDYRDMPTVRAIARDSAGDDSRFSAFIMNIVESPPFQMRQFRSTSGSEAGRR